VRTRFALNLLSAPTRVGVAHVRWGLDGRDVLEDDVAEADQADDGAGDILEPALVEDDGADEDVDCE
jgi:hypothetical protein